MYVDNLQCRGNLIKSLKTNINEEKLYRKKILNNDNSMLQKRSESLGDHDPEVVAHKKNNSFAYNTNLYKQYRNNISNKTKNGKHEDLRVDSLWEVQNTELSVGGQKYNNNTIANDLSFDGGKECQTCANLKRYHIENSVDDSIRKLHDNPIKLYSLLKKYFDDVVRQCPDFKILEKLHNGYIDSMQGILAEYKILKEKNESYEAMMNSKYIGSHSLEYNLLNKKYVEANKLLDSKNEEIRLLKERLSEVNTTHCNTPFIDSNPSNGRNSEALSEHDNNITST
jgi:hypothetical protein